MAPLFCLLKDIAPSRTQWALKLRLVRVYHVPALQNRRCNQSMECVFHDVEGVRIHATIKRDYMSRFDFLKEGDLYAVKNFVVTNNRMRYKTTNNKYMLIFINDTKVCQIMEDDFPNFMFQFRKIAEVRDAEKLNETELFDIIGRVITVNSPQSRKFNGAETKWMEVTLQDNEGIPIGVTLWEEFCEKMLECVRTGGLEAPIMTLQFCRAKVYRDNITISTTYNVTKMLLDGDLPHVSEFRRNSKDVTGNPAVSGLSLTSLSTIDHDFSTATRTTQQIKDGNEAGLYWVSARIVSIETSGHWWYVSCMKCYRKVNKDAGKFRCSICNISDINGKPRYKIEVRVQDDTDNVCLLLWDPQCIELIGKTVQDLRDEMPQEDDPNTFPKAIYNLLDQEVYFKVQVKPEESNGFDGPYNVKKISREMPVLSKFSGGRSTSQGSDFISKIHKESILSEKVGSSEDEVTTPVKLHSVDEKENEECQNSSVKRNLMDEFSTTGVEKKKMRIKQEED